MPDGLAATTHDTDQVAVWTSADGGTWTAITDVPPMSAGPLLRDSDVLATEDRLVVVGWREGEEDPAHAAFAIVGPLVTE